MQERVSDEALERADRAVAAMAVLRMDAQTICAAGARAPADASVLAVVRPDLSSAVYVVSTAELASRQPELEGTGWSMVFAAGTSPAAIDRALLRAARLAEQRRDALFRYAGRDATP